MQIYNFLPHLIRGLKEWKRRPTLRQFMDIYYLPIQEKVRGTFDSGEEMYALLADLNWSRYRGETLKLDPIVEEKRVRKHLADVESLLDIKLSGEIVLFAAFESMDGYARFDQGTHRVFLGVDESHGRGRYLDILEVHELAHVARESRSTVWTGWDLNPRMSHDEFVQYQPTIEHLFGEGYSCAISEHLVTGESPWLYAYQDKKNLKHILKNARSVNTVIHQELKAGDQSDWGRLYHPYRYQPKLPVFTHYVWAWQWASRLIQDRAAGNPRQLLEVCSREFMDHALAFSLEPSVFRIA